MDHYRTRRKQYKNVGLSPQQAEIQALRDAGLKQFEIARETDVSDGHVSAQIARIDEKIENARRLVALAEGDSDE